MVSVAAVLRQPENDKPKLWLWSMSIADHTEGELIANFLERVAKGQWQLWGFNSADADLPILRQRAIALGVPCPEFPAPRAEQQGEQSTTITTAAMAKATRTCSK